MEKEKELKDYVLDTKAKNHIKLVEGVLKRIEEYLTKIESFSGQEERQKKSEIIHDLCTNINKLSTFLESTLDMKNGGTLAINLQKLYQHIRYCVQRIIDEKDFSYIDSAKKVVNEINKGWGKVAACAA